MSITKETKKENKKDSSKEKTVKPEKVKKLKKKAISITLEIAFLIIYNRKILSLNFSSSHHRLFFYHHNALNTA